MRITNEIKAGVVVLLGIALCVMFFAKTTNLKKETYEVKTYFTYAGDLQPNAVVKLSGIEAGRLKAMKFVYGDNTQVECVLEIDSLAKVRTDSIAYIGTAGFVGDAYIGLTFGKSSEFAKDGDIITAEDPIQTRLLMKKADSIAENLDKITLEVKSILVDNKGGIDSIVTNLESITENFKEFSEDVKSHPWKLMFKGE